MEKLNGPCLLFDWASTSNQGKAGALGLIFNLGGINPITYEWGLWELSINRAEAYNLLLGTKMLRQWGMKNPVIMGDSTIVIQSTVERIRLNNRILSQIIKRVEKIFSILEKPPSIISWEKIMGQLICTPIWLYGRIKNW